VHAGGVEADLLAGFPECGVDGVAVAGVGGAAGEDELSRVVGELGGASGDQHARSVGPVGEA